MEKACRSSYFTNAWLITIHDILKYLNQTSTLLECSEMMPYYLWYNVNYLQEYSSLVKLPARGFISHLHRHLSLNHRLQTQSERQLPSVLWMCSCLDDRALFKHYGNSKVDEPFKGADTRKRVELLIAKKSWVSSITETEHGSKTVLYILAHEGSYVLLWYWNY